MRRGEAERDVRKCEEEGEGKKGGEKGRRGEFGGGAGGQRVVSQAKRALPLAYYIKTMTTLGLELWLAGPFCSVVFGQVVKKKGRGRFSLGLAAN